jgi:hypothetical protein
MITKTRAINITDKKTNIAYNILTILRLMTCILTVDKRKTGYNSTYNKLAVQWLNEALYRFGGPIRIKFCGGRQFCAASAVRFVIANFL